MSKLGYVAKTFAQIMRQPIPLKRARQFLMAWGLSLSLNVLTLSVSIMLGAAFGIVMLGVLSLAVNAVFLRNAVERYAEARLRAEREAFVQAMFEEWCR